MEIQSDSQVGGAAKKNLFVKSIGCIAIIIFSIIILYAILIQIAGVFQAFESIEEEKAIKGMETAIDDYLKGDGAVATQPDAGGALGQAEGIFRLHISAMAKDNRDYQNDLAGVGFAGLLQPANIHADSGLAVSKRKIEQSKLIVKKYRNLYAKRLAEVLERIDQADLAEGQKARMKQVFERSMSENGHMNDRVWELEEGIVSETGAIIDLLARTRGSWEIRDNTVIFSDPADSRNFNAYIMRMDAMAEEEEAIQAKQVEKFRAKFRNR